MFGRLSTRRCASLFCGVAVLPALPAACAALLAGNAGTIGAADAVLPSKLTNILAVGGNAVITAEAETELGQLCDSYPGIAVCVEPESVPALVTGIEQALAMPKVNTVAREYAERTLEKENVLSQFIADIRG